MTPEQYARWKQFAMRMAHRGLTRRNGRLLPKKVRKRVAQWVKDFFRTLDVEAKYSDRLIERIRNWDHTDQLERDETKAPIYVPRLYMCDLVSTQEEYWNPHYWSDNEGRFKRWDETWGNRVRCCLRAGLDIASSPSAGVLGFTVGDLRRMYRGSIPEWISEGWCRGPGDSECGISLDDLTDDEGVWL